MHNPNSQPICWPTQQDLKPQQNGNQGIPNVPIYTAVKKPQPNQGFPFTQTTPRPMKKVLLFDQERNKHLFPLVRDQDIGIQGRFQNVVHESFNDDDRATSSTQLYRGVVQTLEDLYEVTNPSGRNFTQ